MKTLTAKLPEQLYYQVEQAASKEHVSLDQFVMIALSAQVSAWMTKDYLRERAQTRQLGKISACVGESSGCRA